MTDSAFYRLGRLAGGKARKVKWMWSSLTGDETEAIQAEYGVGWDMAAVVRERRLRPRPGGTDVARRDP